LQKNQYTPYQTSDMGQILHVMFLSMFIDNYQLYIIFLKNFSEIV